MIGWHIERPQIFFDDKPWSFSRYDKTGNSSRVAILAAGAGKDEIMRSDMHTGIPHFCAIDLPAIAVTHATCFHPRSIRPMLRLGETKGETKRTVENTGN